MTLLRKQEWISCQEGKVYTLVGTHQPLALSGSGASQAQPQQASALGEEIRKGSECSQTEFTETAQSASSTKFSPKSNRCILVFNDFFLLFKRGSDVCSELPAQKNQV